MAKIPDRTDPATIVEARDAAVLRFITRHDGIASEKEMLTAIPRGEPAMTQEATSVALKQSLARLRFKHLIGRTGNTWSLVGAGANEAANG